MFYTLRLNKNLCEIPALKASSLYVRSAERQRTYDRVKLPPITNKKPTKLGFPATTNQQIGWIASKPDQQLEVYGRYGPKSRGQCGILKLLSWPQESAP
ncbi:hypothetical protein KUTeg_013038 [Tegillarca granosa]|uniref:Uncharacterized protein n=1 Tax=Tegillarca granosa TaxID=220873 RepID=A0ABQ9ESI6_TEGGR|nr:hypothetical protein KUTeg_013038 [Tegillarca granosa]